MLITIAAALAAAQGAPATAPAQPTPMAEHSADKMKDCCCCKDMKSGTHPDHAMSGKDEHQGHAAH